MTTYVCPLCGARSANIQSPYSQEQEDWNEHDCSETHERCAMNRATRDACRYAAGQEGCYTGLGIPRHCPN